jgi:hypothetical protein
MKMHIENANSDATTKNLVSLCNVEFILRFPCIIPLLDCMHTLIKLAQHEFYMIYFDLFGMFEGSKFNDFNATRILTNANLPM